MAARHQHDVGPHCDADRYKFSKKKLKRNAGFGAHLDADRWKFSKQKNRSSIVALDSKYTSALTFWNFYQSQNRFLCYMSWPLPSSLPRLFVARLPTGSSSGLCWFSLSVHQSLCLSVCLSVCLSRSLCIHTKYARARAHTHIQTNKYRCICTQTHTHTQTHRFSWVRGTCWSTVPCVMPCGWQGGSFTKRTS